MIGIWIIFYGNKQSKVWWKAWEDGHSYGYYEVYQKLDDLVELFED
jgi:hypothetical protein